MDHNAKASDFLAWCAEHRNSPDKNNFSWWLANRCYGEYRVAEYAEGEKIWEAVTLLKELL